MTFRQKCRGLNELIEEVLNDKRKKRLQKIFWIYPTSNFIIHNMNDFKKIEPRIKCRFLPITFNNYHRVSDFREEYRISQYKDKITRNEIGYFAECEGKMIGSIWATINKSDAHNIVRTYMKLMPDEGLIHDIVTGERSRGLLVGPFMVSKILSILLEEYLLSRIIIDVNMRNRSSLRMMQTLNLRTDHKMLSVSVFGRSVLQLVLKR